MVSNVWKLFFKTPIILLSVKPHIMPFELEDSTFSGESVQMTCHITKGDDPVQISWKFNNDDIRSNLGVSIAKMGDRTSFLSISSVMDIHSGNYTCIAKNNAGISSHTAILYVKGNFSYKNFL